MGCCVSKGSSISDERAVNKPTPEPKPRVVFDLPPEHSTCSVNYRPICGDYNPGYSKHRESRYSPDHPVFGEKGKAAKAAVDARGAKTANTTKTGKGAKGARSTNAGMPNTRITAFL